MDELINCMVIQSNYKMYIDKTGKLIGPLRVWIKNEGIPGLAMTRSFGDASLYSSMFNYLNFLSC